MSERRLIDLYRVLGIDPSATPQQVSAAYLSLARKHHPDSSIAKHDSTAEFKAVAEAYETLSDPDKRLAYDRQWQQGQPSRPRQRSNPSPIFDRSRGSSPLTERIHTDLVADLPISPEEARWGANVSLTLTVSRRCHECQGGGCATCGGRGAMSRSSDLRIRVPAGVCDGGLLRIPGRDCVLRVRVRPSW